MNPMGPYRVGHPDLPARREVGEAHFESVYKRYYRKIYLVCRRYSAKPDDAEDLTHDVFMRYFQNFEKFRHDSSPSTWMYRVAVNLGIQRWRKERIRNQDDQELESIPADIRDTESMLLDKITLKKILDRCPERTRRILSLFHIERMTQVEIGKTLGISRATVIRDLIHLKRYRQRPPKMEMAASLYPR
jgi:RNA polymerase sigma-70 factor, ECF subfamily